MTSQGWPARIAWAACVATWFLAVLDLVILLAAGENLLSADNFNEGFPVVTAATVVGATVGAAIVARDPRNRIGWLLCIGQLGTMLGLIVDDWGDAVVQGQLSGSSAAGHWALWVSQLLSAPYALSLLGALLLLVPDGRLPSRRWRFVVWGLVASLACSTAAVFLIPPESIQPNSVVAEPSAAAETLASIGALLLAPSLAMSAVALVRRLRRSRGVERQQLRWIAFSAVLIALAFGFVILLALLPHETNETPTYAVTPLYLAYLSVPVATGFAVLRYRLYDVDLIISRALVVGVVAVFVTVGYVAVVVLLGNLVGGRAESRFWPSLLATILVALAFQPLRRRVLGIADRIGYGERAAPYEALADLSERLGASLSMTELLPRVAEAGARATGARRCRVQLLVPDSEPVAAVWPEPGPDEPTYDAQFPVVHAGVPVGSIAVLFRAGQSGGRYERSLLTDLSAQCGVAFRNAQLTAALQARSAQLARDAESIDASRRRLVVAAQAERRRLARAINRDVLPRLLEMPDRLRDVETELTGGHGAAESIEALGVGTTQSLDALRVITRGVFPAVLARRGVAAAVRAQLEVAAPQAELDVDPQLADRRFDPRTESAAYFCCLDSARDLDAPLRVGLALDGAALLSVVVEGRTRPDTSFAAAHELVCDRAESLGGQATVTSVGDRVSVRATFPVREAAAVGTVT